MRDVVFEFLAGFLDGEPEDWLVDYVVEFLMDADLVAGGMADLADIISTSCPNFEQLPEHDRHARLSDLHGQVHQQPRSSSDTASPCPRTASAAPAPPAATLPTAHGPSSAPALDSSSAATGPGSPSAGESSGQTLADSDARVNSLRELCPADVSQEFLAHVLEHHGQGSVQRAAEWVLECEDVGKQQAAWLAAGEKRRQQEIKDAAAEKLARKALLARFMLQECKPLQDPNKPRPVQAWSSNQPCRPSTVRYRDGMVASTKGEKYVVQKVGEEWDGGSKGKVYTKGKRGKGVV